MTFFSIKPLPESRGGLPMLVQAEGGVDLLASQQGLRELIDQHLERCGGVLLRGFGDASNLATIHTYCSSHGGAVDIHAIDGKHGAINGHNGCHHHC